MAKRVVTTIEVTDDFDRSKEADDSVEFIYEGIAYTIDTSTERAQAFRDFIAPYIEVASGREKAPRGPAPQQGHADDGRRRVKRTRLPKELRGRIRHWAEQNGYEDEVQSPTIPHAVRSAYLDATGDTSVLDEQLIKYREKERRDRIREWARQNGFDVSPWAIIRSEIIEAYEKEHPEDAALPEEVVDMLFDTAPVKRRRPANLSEGPNSNGVTPHMRDWARDSGFEINSKGYVPRHVRDLYYAAHPEQNATMLNGAHV